LTVARIGSVAGAAALLLIAALWGGVVDRIHADPGGVAARVTGLDGTSRDLLIALAALILGGIALTALAQRDRVLARANAELLEAHLLARIGHWDYIPALDKLTWSLSLNQMYGREPEETVSRLSDILRYISPDEERKVRTAVDHVMRTGERQEYELAVRLRDGSRQIRQLIIVATRGPDGSIIGVHGTDQDITDIKRLESLEAKLVHLSRLDAMNLMAGTLAHEVSQPLTAAINYLAAARRAIARADCAGCEDIDEAVQLSETQVQVAGDILRSVRGMVSSRSDMRTAAIADVWEEALTVVRGLYRGQRILFGEDIADDARFVYADIIQIRQVLANLAGNAIEAVPPDRAPVVSLVVRPYLDGWVAVSVQDNGWGIGKIGQELFSPFATTKEEGLGLGLVLSRTIVEAHGGRIRVEKTSPNGTVITFTLRAAMRPA
jgi:PAS domain S-box-containing protein